MAAFALAARGVVPIERAWTLVSETPAAAVGLSDRGRIALGQRADLLVVDAPAQGKPRVAATIVAGRVVHLAASDRIVASR